MEIAAGDANGATATLQTVLKNDPTNAAAHYQLGLAFQALGNWESAESEWREAVRLRPEFIEAQRSLALLAMRQGDMGTLEQRLPSSFIWSLLLPRATPYVPSRRSTQAFNEAEEDIRKAIAVIRKAI